jgi:glutathione S-transferase
LFHFLLYVIHQEILKLLGHLPMYTLYARPNTGSAPVEALLTLLGVPFTLEHVEKTETGAAPDWYLAINPRGEVPTLILPSGEVMTESAAMMIYLADRHPAAELAPPPDHPQRAQYLRWMLYLASSVYATDLRMYYPDRYSTDPAHAPAIKGKAAIDMAKDFAVLAENMGDGPFILGDRFSAVDLYVCVLTSWDADLALLFDAQPKLQRLYAAIEEIPAVRKVWDRNQMP